MANQKDRWFCRVEITFDADTAEDNDRSEAVIDIANKAFNENVLPRLSSAFPGDDGVNWALLNFGNGIVAKRI